MRAAVCRQYGEALTIDTVELQDLQPGEVRVGIKACAVCQSDLHLLQGHWGGVLPVVAGHEASGVVLETAGDVTDVSAGDTVVVSLIRSCHHCAPCVRGIPTACQTSHRLDNETPIVTPDKQPVTQGIYVGAFADEAVVDQSQLVKFDSALPFDAMALLSCGVITGVGAALNSAELEPGCDVVVIGTGGVGLNAIQGARIAGARRIIAVDIHDEKLQTAEGFGATHLINSAKQDAVTQVRALNPCGVDAVFVTVGHPAVMTASLEMTHKYGSSIITGMPKADEVMIPFDAFLLTQGRRVIGSKMGAGSVRRDIPKLINFYQSGQLDLQNLISGHYPLEDINHAIADMAGGKALRNVIMMEA